MDNEIVQSSAETSQEEKEQKKYCSKCLSEIKQGEKFCSKCGASAGYRVEVAKKKHYITETIGILTGVVSIILGIITFATKVGNYERAETYGGDAYTGIQNAAAQAANNIYYTGEMLRFALASILVVIGTFMIIFFVEKLSDYNMERK